MKVRKDPWPQCVCAQSPQSRLTLCDPIDSRPPGLSAHGVLQARTLEWLPCPPPGDLPNPGSNLSLLCILQCRKILHHGPPEKSHWAWTVFKSVEANSTKLQVLGIIFGSCSSLWACWSAPLLSVPFCGIWSYSGHIGRCECWTVSLKTIDDGIWSFLYIVEFNLLLLHWEFFAFKFIKGMFCRTPKRKCLSLDCSWNFLKWLL